jgi:2-amino-4-hydroxy-6-hydroxymethyldihydropteridine diphosphokinase
MNRVFLLTGSNLGENFSMLKMAEKSIIRDIGKLSHKSGVYKSEPWGYKSKRLFFNQCIEVETELNAFSILEKIFKIESEMGRQRMNNGYSDREIDIDILFYNQDIIEDDKLIIPHPRMHLRRFALHPMNEIAGDFVHPVFKKAISELLKICIDDSSVFLVKEN